MARRARLQNEGGDILLTEFQLRIDKEKLFPFRHYLN